MFSILLSFCSVLLSTLGIGCKPVRRALYRHRTAALSLLVEHITQLNAEISPGFLQTVIVVEQPIGKVVDLERHIVTPLLNGIGGIGVVRKLLGYIQLSAGSLP